MCIKDSRYAFRYVYHSASGSSSDGISNDSSEGSSKHCGGSSAHTIDYERRTHQEQLRLAEMKLEAMTKDYNNQASYALNVQEKIMQEGREELHARSAEAKEYVATLRRGHAEEVQDLQRAREAAVDDASKNMKLMAEKEFERKQADYAAKDQDLLRENADLMRRLRLADSRVPEPIDGQDPCKGCVKRDGSIAELEAELLRSQNELSAARLHATTLEQARAELLEHSTDILQKDSMKDDEILRLRSLVKSLEARASALTTSIDQVRLGHERDMSEQGARDEARIRTISFACDGKINNAYAQIDSLKEEIRTLRAATSTSKPGSAKQRSYASWDTDQQYDIFDKDGDYEEEHGEWTAPEYASHRPKPAPKMYAGTETHTRTRTTTASAPADAGDGGGRPPRRPDDGAGGSSGGGGHASAAGRRSQDEDLRPTATTTGEGRAEEARATTMTTTKTTILEDPLADMLIIRLRLP